jgi:hypothetical protein
MDDKLEISVDAFGVNPTLFKIDHEIVQEILRKPVQTASGHAAIYRYSPTMIMKFSNPHEVQVYEHIKQFEDLKTIVPTYYGFVDLPRGELRDHFTTNRKVEPDSFRYQKDHCVFVIMEDLLSNNISKPHVTDIKLGKCNYEENDEEEKKRKHRKRAKETGMDVWGGRFDGISIFGLKTLHKKDLWIHTFSDNLIYYLIPEFNYQCDENIISSLNPERKNRVIVICNILVEKLSKIHEILIERQSHFNFLQSSIFILYEGDTQKLPYADARLIDFDHTHYKDKDTNILVTPQVELDTFNIGDAGISFGIKSVIKLLNELVVKLN